MQTIPITAIDDAWEELNEAEDQDHDDDGDPQGEPAIVAEFAEEQPHVLAFLVAGEETIEKMDDRGILIFYGMWAWLSFKYNGRSETLVTEQSLHTAFERNMQEMKKLEADVGNVSHKSMRAMTANYPQMPLLGAIIQNLAEGDVETEGREDDLSGMILIYAKSVVDAFHATP